MFWTRNFFFNSYVYYLTHDFIGSTRAFNLRTRAFNLLTRAFSLPTQAFILSTRAFSVLTREFKLVTRGIELVTREFELVTRVLLFHDCGVIRKYKRLFLINYLATPRQTLTLNGMLNKKKITCSKWCYYTPNLATNARVVFKFCSLLITT